MNRQPPEKPTIDPAHWPGVGDALGLSTREIAVIRGVFKGWTERRIALSLGVSPHTVHAHLRRVYRKLDVHDRCELVLRVVETRDRLYGDFHSEASASG